MNPCKLVALILAFGAVSQAGAVGNALAGKTAFNKCASCHQLGPSARGGFGPQLNAIVGRMAGSTNDYAYSAAMKNARIIWSEKTLAAFLKSPGNVVPGTKMRFWGISDEQQIADLLTYLQTFQ